jgi:hypothetical protein
VVAVAVPALPLVGLVELVVVVPEAALLLRLV